MKMVVAEFGITAKDIIENCIRGFDVVIYFHREKGKWEVSSLSSGERLNPKYYIEVWRQKANDILDTPSEEDYYAFENMVEEGKIPKEKADRVMSLTEKGYTLYEACEEVGIDVEEIVRESALGILEYEIEKIEKEVRENTLEILGKEFDEVVEKIEEYEERLEKEEDMPDTQYFCETIDEFFSDNGLRDVFEEADPIAIDSHTADRWVEEVSGKRGNAYEIWEKMSEEEKKEVWKRFWNGFSEDVETYRMNLKRAVLGE